MENLKSHEIWQVHFPYLENRGVLIWVMEVVEIANYCVRTWVNLLLCKAANNFFSFLVLGISEKKGSKTDDGKLVKFIKEKKFMESYGISEGQRFVLCFLSLGLFTTVCSISVYGQRSQLVSGTFCHPTCEVCVGRETHHSCNWGWYQGISPEFCIFSVSFLCCVYYLNPFIPKNAK